MRILIASCIVMIGVQEVRSQSPARERAFGEAGRITEYAMARANQPPEPDLSTPVREPAPFGRLQVKEWRYDPFHKYRYSLEDTYGNTWFVVFESSQEDFGRNPQLVPGWIMEIEGGCLRVGTLRGSYLVSSKDMRGKGIPNSFEVLSPNLAKANGKATVKANVKK